MREADLERRVSAYLADLRLLWLEVDDEPGKDSDRAVIEQNAIALLADCNGPIDRPTLGWLGLHSPEDCIRRSGLWNVNHVGDKCDPAFLDTLEGYVETTMAHLVSGSEMQR
jgi:hypothetical protein